ncbi:MAG: hypothetical protein QGH45_12035 [Myxococcota bacterium]|jgi:hypothetical protein|nr:hypothetical protein [Myxococcota bacterium]
MRRVAALVLGVCVGAVVGCEPTIHHATMEPELLDYGVIEIDGSKTLPVTFSNLEADPVYLYFLAPSTFAADMVPAGDDQGTPFELGEELEIQGSEDLTLDVNYGCWAQDRGFFRWEISVMSSTECDGYWNATREVGVLTLKGSCGDEW